MATKGRPNPKRDDESSTAMRLETRMKTLAAVAKSTAKQFAKVHRLSPSDAHDLEQDVVSRLWEKFLKQPKEPRIGDHLLRVSAFSIAERVLRDKLRRDKRSRLEPIDTAAISDSPPSGPAEHREWSTVLSFEIPEHVDPAEANALIAKLLGHMSQRNIELGGRGFQIRDTVGFVPSRELVPAGGDDDAGGSRR